MCGAQVGIPEASTCKVDDLPSTAASSAVHSPIGRPDVFPHTINLEPMAAITLGSAHQDRPPSPQGFIPEVEVADEDPTIAASIEHTPVNGTSMESSTWPSVDSLKEPHVKKTPVQWQLTEQLNMQCGRPAAPRYQGGARNRRPKKLAGRRGGTWKRRSVAQAGSEPSPVVYGAPFIVAFDSDVGLAPGSPTSAAWLRVSDDAYPSAAANLLQW